ncbi:hypothetical protein [Streptomyces sp. 5-10]|uniref:hypothetical protein n=1 Tax=Streptomyces sp. 5-10 TaxID=878925 RepID=UPI00168C0733|nr:hypothetical protein [Streptomyces sp. 5-10]MBD3004608.1 hypothetical protein [Streptomyces sp. 5-10]
MTAEDAVHWATVTWYGTHDLANELFVEVLSGKSETGLYRLCHAWAYHYLADEAEYEAKYMGQGAPDRRENDPRRRVPINTEHEMTARQRACFEEAQQALAAVGKIDPATCPEWRTVKPGARSEG